MTEYQVEWGYTRRLQGATFEQAVARTTEALKAEGFGVLTTIDVQETLKKKLDVDFRRYVILGACNPGLAHRALRAELGVGLFLPCNVTVFEGDAGEVVVQAVRPQAMLASAVGAPGLEALAVEADEKIRRAVEAL
jgi:uncharacterized protein (DUF302 family)